MAEDSPALTKVLSQNHLQFVKHLGSGTFGDVFQVKDRKTGRKYAIKSSHAPSDRETLLWGGLRHENVLPLYQVVTVQDWKTLYVMPIMPESLFHIVQTPAFRVRADALIYIRRWLGDILSGIGYMHQNQLAHLDLKPDNVLISADYRAVVTDFSFVAHSKKPTLSHGTPAIYEPPEVYPSRRHSAVDPEALDLWSIGMIAVEALTNHSINRLSSIPSPNDWIHHNYPMLTHLLQANILRDNISSAFPRAALTDQEFSDLRNFIFSLLRIDPGERSAASLAMNHRFLGGTFSRPDTQDLTTQMQSIQFASSIVEFHNSLNQRTVPDASLRPVNDVFPSWIKLDQNGDFLEELGPSAPLPPQFHTPFRLPAEPTQENQEPDLIQKVTFPFILLSIAQSLPRFTLLLLSMSANWIMEVTKKATKFSFKFLRNICHLPLNIFKSIFSIISVVFSIANQKILSASTVIAIAKILQIPKLFLLLMSILKIISKAFLLLSILLMPLKKLFRFVIVFQLKIMKKSFRLKRKIIKSLYWSFILFIKGFGWTAWILKSVFATILCIIFRIATIQIIISIASLFILIKKSIVFKRPLMSTLKKYRSKFKSSFDFSLFNPTMYFTAAENNQNSLRQIPDSLSDELCQLFLDKLKIIDSNQ